MDFEIEFKLIDIKDINKIQRIEKEEDNIFGVAQMVECKHDITDEYCKDIMNRVMYANIIYKLTQKKALTSG